MKKKDGTNILLLSPEAIPWNIYLVHNNTLFSCPCICSLKFLKLHFLTHLTQNELRKYSGLRKGLQFEKTGDLILNYNINIMIVYRITFIAIIFISLCNCQRLEHEPCVEDGNWTMKTHEVYHIHASRIVNPYDDKLLGNMWLAEACPVESIIFSCYYRNKSNSIMADYRRWEPLNQDSKCHPYYPFDFLTKLSNKKLVFYGDSIIGQIYFALVCSLTKLSKYELDTEFYTTGPNKFCPFGSSHCCFLDSKIYFPSVNVTILFVRMHRSNPLLDGVYFGIQSLNQAVAGLTQTDIVIWNMGLHVNQPKEYHTFVKWFIDDVKNVSNRKSLPHMFFYETTPQHFHTHNGEYSSEVAAYMVKNNLQCLQYNVSDNEHVEHDWRNKILNHLLPESLQSQLDIYLIRIAKGLYSQYDVHIGRTENFNIQNVDCTHYCFPGGVFDYIIRMTYNSMLYRQAIK